MHKVGLISILLVIFSSTTVQAEIVVHEPNFVVDVLLDQIDVHTPILEVIRNPVYGNGVIAANVDNGTLNVLRISDSNIDIIGTMAGNWERVIFIRFDTTGIFDNLLYISMLKPDLESSDLLKIMPDGQIEIIISETGYNSTFGKFVFTSGGNGWQPGSYIWRQKSFYFMDAEFDITLLCRDNLPPGRTDVDNKDLQFDMTGKYGSNLIFADTDQNNDQITIIYKLFSDLTWGELTTEIHTDIQRWGDGGMDISPGGDFGETLYITELKQQKIVTVDPTGLQEDFATGFTVGTLYEHKGTPFSLSIAEDGNFMYVSDTNGVYRIRAITTDIGPSIVMQEPKVKYDGVHTNPSGVDNLRLLWSENIVFENSDVYVTDANSVVISDSVSGSNSKFMIISFGQTLLNNKYTITIKDTVVSAESGNAIDGDEDGFAGGDAVIVMEHRERHDSDNDNDIDLLDFGRFTEKWLWSD